MKIAKFVLPVILLALIGGFLYVALTDVPVVQTEVRKTIDSSHSAQ